MVGMEDVGWRELGVIPRNNIVKRDVIAGELNWENPAAIRLTESGGLRVQVTDNEVTPEGHSAGPMMNSVGAFRGKLAATEGLFYGPESASRRPTQILLVRRRGGRTYLPYLSF